MDFDNQKVYVDTSITDGLVFISVLNILGRGQIKTPYNTEGKDEVIQKDGRR